MCLGQFSPSRSTISMDPPTVRDSDSRLRFTTTLDAMAAQPSWSLRKVFKSHAPVRPGVARRLGRTAKINLNKYWHVLEDMVHVETSFPTKPRDDSARDYEDIGMSNEINENLANERYEILSVSTSRPTETMDVDKPPTPPQAQAPQMQPPQESAALRVDHRERAPKKPITSKMLTPKSTKSTRSPLAIINGNQRKSLTPAKPPPAVRVSPATPKSPMTALAENFQRRLSNRI